MKKRLLLATLFVFWAVSLSLSMEKDERIMKKGVRPMGMGGAFVAVSDDENAVFYNPAGITQRESWFLSLVGFGASVSGETINLVGDAIDIMGDMDGDSGMSVKDMKKYKDIISNKDVDFRLTSLFLEPFFISNPIQMGNNSLSFGIGAFSSVDAGVNIILDLPDYVLSLAEISERTGGNITEADLISALPPDILKDFGSNLTIPQLRQLLETIAGGGSAADQAAQDIYDSLDQDSKNLIDSLQVGDKSLQDVIDEFPQDVKDKLLGRIGAKGIINTYATVSFDIPLAYRFKSLESIKMPGEMSVGVNLKFIERFKVRNELRVSVDDIGQIEDNFDILDIAGVSGFGFGLDLGAIYHYTPQWNFGLQIADIFTRIDYSNILFKYPDNKPDSNFAHTAYIAPQFNIGAAYTPSKIIYGKDKYFETKKRWTFAADLRDLFGAYDIDFVDKFHIGAEYRFSPFALRVGLNKFRPTFGAGLETNSFQLSYAFYGDKSYLAKALGEDKTVYYHEIILSVKLGYHDGKPFGSNIGKKERETAEKAEKDRIKNERAAQKAEEKRIAAEKKAADKAAKEQAASQKKAEQEAARAAQKVADETAKTAAPAN